ncbi:hypothetical protein MOBT1_002603 [Malassezia obtusa]|uniref:Uncharacterized protein n=1 Tax=Malassezia obtusa TaxID=76774 RepID=A0AAF0IXB3_9BASI|nr:hypothetical protein MOBT1_002603 [Malassezia obtusa]
MAPAEPSEGAMPDASGSSSPRRLSTLARSLSLRNSPRGRSPVSPDDSVPSIPPAHRTSSLTDPHDARRGSGPSPSLAPASPLFGTLPGLGAETRPSSPARLSGHASPSNPLRRAASPLSLHSLSRVPSRVFSSERRRADSEAPAVPVHLQDPMRSASHLGERTPTRGIYRTSSAQTNESSGGLFRAPSFLHRGSAGPAEAPARGGLTEHAASAPGLTDAYSPLSSGANTPVPSYILGDEVPRSASPLAITEPMLRPRAPAAAERVVMRVEPVSNRINMFGPLQVSSHYSLSGKITFEVPVCEEALDLRGLDVHLVGYSMYVDSSARFSSVRICDVKQSLVTTPTPFPARPGTGAEVDFDLFAPGWLPASFAARSASTFYSLEAVAWIGEVKAPSPPTSDAFASAPAPPVVAEVRSTPQLVRVSRSRDTVPIPVAQHAVFTGEDVPEPKEETVTPFVRSTNPFRSVSSRNPFLQQMASSVRTNPQKDHAAAAQQETHRRITNRVPLRHFSHIPKIPLPVPIVIEGKVHEHLPLKLTLSVPAHTNTHAESDKEQAPLVFGLQVELDPLWAQSKMWSDLRLCELEAMCVQMEKYSSTLSRSYCTAFSLPLQGDVGATQVPFFDPNACAKLVPPTTGSTAYPYNRHLLEGRIRQQRAGTAPTERRNHAERYRSYTVGPLPQSDAKGKKKQPDAPPPPPPPPAPASPPPAPSRKKRSLTAPFSRLSMFSHRDHHDERASAPSAESLVLPPPKAQAPVHENPKASYVFEGADGCGMSLSAKKVRLSFSLPMVPSNGAAASQSGTTQLLPDYESPHVRIRHKFKVKLRFGYGSSQLALNAGTQSLVMCVPVRFTESPPSEALAQAAPVIFPPAAQRCVPAEGKPNVPVPAAFTQATHSVYRPAAGGETPYLPAYIQLFREDGSRLADDTEMLPRYPDEHAVPWVHDEVDAAFAAYLENTLALAPDDLREQKSAAPTSVVETLNTADELFEVDAAEVGPQRVDDDLLDADMQQTTVVTGASGLDYDIDLDTREMNGVRSPNMFASTH